MLSQHKLAQKRHSKALKRKNKKYTGPKYSRLDQLFMIAPLMERAGIQMFGEPEDGIRLPERGKHTILKRDGSASDTSFTE
jgi:hypothetical protein